MVFQSKQILNATGYIDIKLFSFKVREIKKNKTFKSSGKSKVSRSVKNNKEKLIKSALYNGMKKIFPSGSFTPYDIIIYSYDIVYYTDRYQIVPKTSKKGKTSYYERYRDTENKRTRYSKIDIKKEYTPSQDWY
jgi:hypothetical protein